MTLNRLATLALILLFVLFLLFCLYPVHAQTPSVETPLSFTCTSTVSSNIKVLMNFDKDPIEQLHILVRNFQSQSSDKTSPIINFVQFTGNKNPVESVLLPNTTSVNFSVSASDDTAVTCAVLTVDDIVADTNCWAPGLPSPFGLRWNPGTIALGGHQFNLRVLDAATNEATKSWRMVR